MEYAAMQNSRMHKVFGWMRKNLFSSFFNGALTVVSFYFLYTTIPPIFDWLFFSSSWSGSTANDCARTGGACWVFIKENIKVIFYGYYPQEYTWRPNSVLLLLILLVVPLFFDWLNTRAKVFLGLFILFIFPFIAFAIIHGALFGIEFFDLIVGTEKWGGLMLTLILSSVGIVASLPIGILLALGRRSTNMPIVSKFCVGFIEAWRGAPLITVLFMASVMLPLFLPEGSDVDKLSRALIGITLFQSAYMAEVIRGGLQAIPKGQFEAADALGLNYWQKMVFIILPQALKIVIPGIVNTFIELFKDTTLVSIIGMTDFLGIVVHGIVTSPDWLHPMVPHTGFVFVAIIYFIFCYSMSRYSQHIEDKLHTGHKR